MVHVSINFIKIFFLLPLSINIDQSRCKFQKNYKIMLDNCVAFCVGTSSLGQTELIYFSMKTLRKYDCF